MGYWPITDGYNTLPYHVRILGFLPRSIEGVVRIDIFRVSCYIFDPKYAPDRLSLGFSRNSVKKASD